MGDKLGGSSYTLTLLSTCVALTWFIYLKHNHHLHFHSSFLFSYQSHKFANGPTVFHDSLHVDSLTIGEHLVAQAIDGTIPDRRATVGKKNTTISFIILIFLQNKYFGHHQPVSTPLR